jgi:hypothetical protein
MYLIQKVTGPKFPPFAEWSAQADDLTTAVSHKVHIMLTDRL